MTRAAHDVIAPTESYSAARFCADARAAVEEIRARGRVPILAGGTMLYFKAWTEGLSALPRRDADVRAAIDAEAAERGWPAMHAELARVDAPTAARLAPGDAQRIQRALEVARLTGQPLSSWQGQRKPAAVDDDAVRIALVPGDRARLHREIGSRFDAMLAAGLVEELASLRSRYTLEPSMSSMRCVGYRQAWAFLDGEIDREGLRSAGIAATRQLAKRQLTWLRSIPAQAFDPWEPDLSARVVAAIERA